MHFRAPLIMCNREVAPKRVEHGRAFVVYMAGEAAPLLPFLPSNMVIVCELWMVETTTRFVGHGTRQVGITSRSADDDDVKNSIAGGDLFFKILHGWMAVTGGSNVN